MAEARSSSESSTEEEELIEYKFTPSPTPEDEKGELQAKKKLDFLLRDPLPDPSVTTCAQVKDFSLYHSSSVYETERTHHLKPTKANDVHFIRFRVFGESEDEDEEESSDNKEERNANKEKRSDYEEKRSDYEEKRSDYEEKRSDYKEKRNDYKEERSDYEEKRSDYKEKRSDYKEERSDNEDKKSYSSDMDDEEEEIYGKWMVFRHFDELDETWEKIRTAIERNELLSCNSALCSTLRYNPSIAGPGPDTKGVICVYTTEEDMIPIGFKLVELEQHDIKYKTDQDSRDFKYAFTVSGPVCIKTIYWNNGRPSFECEDKPCHATSRRKEDIWRLNVVEAPESLNLGAVNGRWVLSPEYQVLTWLWHFLKESVESKEKNFGVIRMVCPPKRNFKSPTEKPEIHVYTNRASKRKVGLELIKIVERDIVYQYKPHPYQERRASAPTRAGFTSQHSSHQQHDRASAQERRASAHQYNSDQPRPMYNSDHHYRASAQERRAGAHQYNFDQSGPAQDWSNNFGQKYRAPAQERRASAHHYNSNQQGPTQDWTSNSDHHYGASAQRGGLSAHQYNSDQPGPVQERSHHYRPQDDRAPGREQVLFWNDGEPDYEQVRRKGITRNWRTGEPVV